MVEKFDGEKEMDDLWHEYVGSFHMHAFDELKKLNGLKNHKVIPRSKIYSLYTMSKHWKWVRAQIIRRDNFRCVQCKSNINLHVDHIHYPGFGNEKPSDLQTLCELCHAKKTTNWDMAAKRKSIRVRVESKQLFSVLRRRM